MGKTCSRHRKEQKCMRIFSEETSEDVVIAGRIILE